MTVIRTNLLKEGEVDTLTFTFEDGEVKSININDPTDGTTLKSVFNEIVKLSMDSDVTLEALIVDPSIGGGLLAEVFTEYITDLNAEIARVRAELRVYADNDETED
jgi:hypothetical protein